MTMRLNPNGLPRLKMALELGLFLGAQRFGGDRHTAKHCLILDTEPYRFQEFISDLAGRDGVRYYQTVEELISRVAEFLRLHARNLKPAKMVPGGAAVARDFSAFNLRKPTFCREIELSESELTFGDLSWMIFEWLRNESTETRVIAD